MNAKSLHQRQPENGGTSGQHGGGAEEAGDGAELILKRQH